MTAMLDALNKGGAKSWQRFQRLWYQCLRCNKAVLYVMDLQPTAIVYTAPERRHAVPETMLGDSADPKALAQWYAQDGHDAMQRGARMVSPIPDPAPAHRTLILARCGCRVHHITLHQVLADLAAGIKERKLNPKTANPDGRVAT